MRIGIDLGGTKIEGVALGDDGAQLARRRVATPRHDYAATLESMAGLVRDLEAETGRRGSVGVGMPGAISPATGLVKNANSTWLIGQPLDRDLSGLLGRQVRVANDANCFALSEAVDGAGGGGAGRLRRDRGHGRGRRRGGGPEGADRPQRDRRRVGPQPPAVAPRRASGPGRACYCGKTGCVETFLSGPGLARDFRQATGRGRRRTGDRGPRASAETRRPLPRSSATRSGMARALAVVLNIVDPDVIVLGGGMSQIARLYQSVPRLWQEWAFSDRVDTVLRPPVHGDSSGVRGAAWLWGPGEA